jgi:hypothetical protein
MIDSNFAGRLPGFWGAGRRGDGFRVSGCLGDCQHVCSLPYLVFSPQNGFLSSLPFIVAWVLGILGGWLADFLLSKNFRLITVRKFITLLGRNRDVGFALHGVSI